MKKSITAALVSLGLAALLVACGGGGGDGGASAPTLQQPPTTAATLAQSAAEAQEAVKAALAGSSTVVTQAAGLDSSFFLLGNPLGAAGSPINLAGRVMAASREKAAAVQTVGCAALFGTPCSGSVTVDTNAPETASLWPAGTYIAMSFSALSGTFEGSSFAMSGTVRIDFQTAVDVDAASFVNTRIQIATIDMSGTVDGVAFGPESDVALIEFDAAGLGTVTVDGVRITGWAGLDVIDANNFSIIGTVLRSAYWGAASTYVDTVFSNWLVVAGRPQPGSTGNISAGTAGVAIGVTSSSASTVVYDVLLTAGGVATRYTVTASYPDGGGAPTYVAQPAP